MFFKKEKMTQHHVAGGGKDRPFLITGGLQEGYGPSEKLHNLGEVVAAHHGWQKVKELIMGVMISGDTVSYGWPQDGAIQCASEPGFAISGSVNPIYDAELTDEQVWERLVSMAGFVAGELGQTRIYVTFAGVTKILQAEASETPTGN